MEKIPKKILVVDDSALMRSVLCDIINSDERFKVVQRASNGIEAFDLLSRNTYDAVVLDVNMPKMNGLELLKELRKYKISARVMMASTDTMEGAKTTLDALEFGALDFVHKPNRATECRVDEFKQNFLNTLAVVANSNMVSFTEPVSREKSKETERMIELIKKKSSSIGGNKIVAIASSTGGPKALQALIPSLPKDLNAPVVLVQHMPKGFTKAMAERLDSCSEVKVKEAEEGDVLEKGVVYVAMGGLHLHLLKKEGNKCSIHYEDGPTRNGVKPCANYMYESLADSDYDEIVCVVLTGMGADGTEGITCLKSRKKIHVISQDQESCVVYGMPRSVVNAGLSNQEIPLNQISQEIILQVGVQK